MPQSSGEAIGEIIQSQVALFNLRRGREQPKPRTRVVELGRPVLHGRGRECRQTFVRLPNAFGATNKVTRD